MKTQDSLMLYKLMALYMIKVAKSPLTVADISDYILEKGYTDSLKFQIVINDLENNRLINFDRRSNRTYLSLTEDGQTTINSLESRIAQNIRNDIYHYLAINASALKDKHSLVTSHTKVSEKAYVVECIAKDKEGELINIKLTFPTENLAINACENFKKNSEDIYKYLIEKLM